MNPIPNAALFWYNSFRNNESGDNRSLHGACPVIKGEKWAVNKWVLSRGQEWTRQCKPNHEFILSDFITGS